VNTDPTTQASQPVQQPVQRPAKTRPARIERQDLQADVTVIGAGFAGLTAAALLANEGLNVRVLERDVHPGGCAAAYTRKTKVGEFRFAVGATVAAGLEPGGLLDQLYSRLNMKPQFEALDPAMRLHLRGSDGNERKVQLHGTRERWAIELERAFPGQLEHKKAFWKEVQGISDVMHHAARSFPVMPFKSLNDVLDTAKGFHPQVHRVLLNLYRTVGDLLEKHQINDPAHRALIDGQLLDSMQCTSQTCALPNGSYALEIYRYGAQYVPGGLARIAEDFSSAIRNRGGEIHYATRARRVIVEQGKTVGVETHGRTFRSPIVISTAPLEDTVTLLGESSPEDLGRRAANLPEIWGAFTLYIAVRDAALPADVHRFEQVIDYSSDNYSSGSHSSGSHGSGLEENFLVSISAPWDRSRAPEGHRAITISTHVRAQDWQNLEPEAYRNKKHQLEQRITNRLESLWPGFNANVVHLETGTPRTFEQFTLHSLGRVGGVPQTPRAANFHAQHHSSGIPGLYLAGETIFPGQGTIGVAVSGFNAYRAAKRFLNRQPSTHRALTPLIGKF
jgi:C-3',4' desaturase CrtD